MKCDLCDNEVAVVDPKKKTRLCYEHGAEKGYFRTDIALIITKPTKEHQLGELIVVPKEKLDDEIKKRFITKEREKTEK